MSHRTWAAYRAVLVALVLGPAATMGGASETGTFDITVRGIKAGVLSYSGDEVGGRYAAAGLVRSAGMASAFVDAQVDVTSRGRVDGNRYRPAAYTERGQEGDERRVVEYAYRGGAPVITRDPPRSRPPRHAADPAQQSGTLDPMTTAYAMLRDRPRDLACALRIDLFDGRRRANIRYAEAKPREDGGITCRGEYRRVAGFSPEDLAEKPVWPFTVIYEPQGEVLRVREVEVPTTFGTLRMRRR